MAVLSPNPAPGGWKIDWNAKEYNYHNLMKKLDAQFMELQKKSDELPRGQVVGGIYSYPVADGHAHYLVIKDKPLTLAHIPYSDAWELPDAHIRGLQRQDVLQHLEHQKKMNKLFGKKEGVHA